MFNTAEIQPTGQVVPKVRRVEMIFGEPLYFENYGDSTDQKVLREVTDRIMNTIQALSGQEYVDLYATKRKAEMNDEVEED
jgi:1-acyl-sn-glycerol-3-phosphate acyltransferase